MRNIIYCFKSLSNICLLNMIGQKKISAFFSPSVRGAKRPLSSVENTEENKAPKQQNSPQMTVPSSSETSTLTADQMSVIEKKRNNAIAKRQKRMSGDSVSDSSSLMGGTWEKALASQFTKPYFINLKKFVDQERKSQKVFPPADQVYSWTQMCDIRDVKVVILGQDPYHNIGQAHGLCFSVPHGIAPPPSLVNMYKELQNDIEGFERPTHGNLTGWAKQGVLLLNAVLTVRAHTPNSHKDKGWEQFTDAVISWINTNLDDVVFMLWGSYAQKKGKVINKKRHKVLTSVHPSPLSAHRGFLGCKHFSQANKHLENVNRTPIDWKQL